MRLWKPYHQGLWKQLPGGVYPFGLRAAKAEVLHRMGDFARLEDLCLKDLDKAEIGGLNAAYCLMKLGVLAAQKGDSENGRRKLNQALKLFQKGGEQQNAFYCRAFLVNVCIQQQRFAEAEAAASELAKEAEERGDRKALINALNLQGLVAMDQGQSEKAIVFLERKLELSKQLGLRAEQATTLGNMGCVRIDQKRYQEALQLILESLKICRAIGDPYAEYCTIYNLASAYEGMGRLREALASYRDDLKLARQLGDGPGEAQIMGDIARVESKINNAEKERA
jgi:tetratricopeptide (TPR) repeat protein